MEALWWALAFGAGLGGNGTIIGASANVVVASLSERTPHPITSAYWTRRGLPMMLFTLVVASVLYVPACLLSSVMRRRRVQCEAARQGGTRTT